MPEGHLNCSEVPSILEIVCKAYTNFCLVHHDGSLEQGDMSKALHVL